MPMSGPRLSVDSLHGSLKSNRQHEMDIYCNYLAAQAPRICHRAIIALRRAAHHHLQQSLCSMYQTYWN